MTDDTPISPTPGRRLPAGERTLAEELELLHRAPQQFRDPDLAPAVDHLLLQRLVRRELSALDARLVYDLIDAFQSWNEAYAATIIDEFRRRPK